MDDLISRQAAIEAITDERIATNMDSVYDSELHRCKRATHRILASLPSTKRRGRWEHIGGDEWFCTACGHIITTEGSWERPWQKYCEECGAKMDEVEDDNN